VSFLYKRKFRRYIDAAGKRVTKSTPGAVAVEYESPKWYGEFIDHQGAPQRLALSTDKSAARQLLAEHERRAERRKSGLIDCFDEHRRAPLAKHLEAFRLHLETKRNAPDHVADTVRYVKRVVAGQAFLPDLTADRVRAVLQDLAGQGRAARTINAYLTAAKSFCQWCVRDGRAPDNPLAHLSTLNVDADVRLRRRTLTDAEFGRLVTAAEKSAAVVFRLVGTDRAMLYCMAVGTGLRANELASLAIDSLHLDADPPIAVVEAGNSKRRRRDEQPLPEWLTARLRNWLQRRPSLPWRTLFPGPWRHRAAEMLREDLAAVELPYRDESDRVFDFHALRHQYISSLAAAGVHPKVAQTLARHSTIDLTMNRYTHLALADLRGALETVADPTTAPGDRRERATGTDGRGATLGVTERRQAMTFPVISTDQSASAPSERRPRSRSRKTAVGSVSGDADDDPGPGPPEDSKSGAGKPVGGSSPLPSATTGRVNRRQPVAQQRVLFCASAKCQPSSGDKQRHLLTRNAKTLATGTATHLTLEPDFFGNTIEDCPTQPTPGPEWQLDATYVRPRIARLFPKLWLHVI
jgi:integrase/recombinase XerD